MSEKPITQRIKDRLAAYTAMLRDIDNQLERLDRMEMTMASPPGPDLTGMPRGSGTPSDRTGMMVERKMELEEQIDRLKAEEKQERNAIEGLILQLSDPDERAVIRLRYFDRADWESACGVLFGDRRDYVDRVDAYATGGFTSGPSIAGEDPRYPTEAVISFNPAYRSQNLSYWAEAGRMLGASSEADYEPISSGSGTAVVYDLSGLSFSPQIKVEGDTDEDALIRKLRDLEPEFIDFILEALSRREGGAYVTADSRLY